MNGSAQRKRILDAALDKLNRYGIRRVTMDDLARELRVSKKTLYVHFPDKEALVRACLERLAAEVIPELQKALQARLPARERLAWMWQTLSVMRRSVSTELLSDLQTEYPQIWDEIAQKRRAVLVGFEKFFVDAAKSGELRPELHPKVALRILMAIVENVMVPDVLAAGEFSHAQAAETIATLLENGMLRRPARRRSPGKKK
jgi:AcrR family transcriptional regulator